MHHPLRRIRKALGLLQAGWTIFGITLLFLVLFEAAFRLAFAVKDRLADHRQPDRRVLDEGYGGAAWPIQHYRELARLEDRWQPFVYFRQKPFQGQTITVNREGLRASWQPPPGQAQHDQPKVTKLLMLGGSSLWGFGARNDHTIPSCLVRELTRRGYRIELRNLAEIGYVSTQEVIALLGELQAGYRPDLVIFYDGVNDTTSALLEGEAGLTTNEVNRRGEFNLLQSPGRLAATLIARLVKDSGSYRIAQSLGRRFRGGVGVAGIPLPPGRTSRQLGEEVVRRYAANLAIVEQLGRGFGFQPLFYWQPVIFTKPLLSPSERDESQKYAGTHQLFHEVHGAIGRSTELQANRAFRDLSGLFAGVEALVFIDYCHTTETANAQVATVLAGDVVNVLRRSTSQSR